MIVFKIKLTTLNDNIIWLQTKDDNNEKIPKGEPRPQLANKNRKKRETQPKQFETISKPFFLSWLIDCLEIEENEISVSELVKSVTYDQNDEADKLFNYVMTSPENVTPLDKPFMWKNFKEKIIRKNYHISYGDCVTIDLESLSENDGKFPISLGSDKTTVKLSINMEDHINDTIELSEKVN